MEKGVAAFILGISLMITIPITIGLFAVKGSMDNISLGDVATGMDSISGNLEKINRVLGSITEEDLQLIRENIFNYLCSKEADIYRYNTFAKFLYNSFKEIIKS